MIFTTKRCEGKTKKPSRVFYTGHTHAALGVKLHEADPSHCFSMIFIIKQSSREAVKAFFGVKNTYIDRYKNLYLGGFPRASHASAFRIFGRWDRKINRCDCAVYPWPGTGKTKQERKVGGTSAMPRENLLLFSWHCVRFALLLNKVGGTSAMPRENLLLFSWHCVRFALLLHHNCAERQNLRKFANLIEQSKQIHKLITYDET